MFFFQQFYDLCFIHTLPPQESIAFALYSV
jgi:hypothetical protein